MVWLCILRFRHGPFKICKYLDEAGKVGGNLRDLDMALSRLVSILVKLARSEMLKSLYFHKYDNFVHLCICHETDYQCEFTCLSTRFCW